MIQIKNLTKYYSRFKALDNINLAIPADLITGVIGPNGAGKSTLIRILTGFEVPDSGEIYFENKLLSSFYLRRSLISYMPEQMDIYPDYYVKEFIRFIHQASGYRDDELLDILGLLSVRNKKNKELSKGYRQRLKLYCALCNKKNIVVLDEPFDSFDPIQMIDILSIIKKEKKEGRRFIISIHQLADAEKICEHYILLNEGKLVEQGTMTELMEKYGKENDTLEKIFLKVLR